MINMQWRKLGRQNTPYPLVKLRAFVNSWLPARTHHQAVQDFLSTSHSASHNQSQCTCVIGGAKMLSEHSYTLFYVQEDWNWLSYSLGTFTWLTLLPYRSEFCKLCPLYHPINKIDTYELPWLNCIMKDGSPSCERIIHIVASCWILLKQCVWLFHLWNFTKTFFSIHLANLLELLLNAIWGPLICLTFIVHHMPTFRPWRGISWIKCLSRTPVLIILGRNRGLWLLRCVMVARFCFTCGCIVILYGDYHKWMLRTGVWYLEQYFFHSCTSMKERQTAVIKWKFHQNGPLRRNEGMLYCTYYWHYLDLKILHCEGKKVL